MNGNGISTTGKNAMGAWRSRLLFGAMLALVGTTMPPVAQAQAPAIGLHAGSDYATSQYHSFGDWLGSPVLYRVTFLEKGNWSSATEPAFLHITSAWVKSRAGRTEVISMALLPDSETGGFGVINSGSKDAYFKNFATKVQAAGVADRVIVRLGWEANGNWYKWSYQSDPAGFRSAFRRVVQVMRAAAPKLRFEFCISNLATRGTKAKWTEGYPGNDVVDVISMDIYDHWNTWDTMVKGDAGLAEMRQFAIANGKQEAYSEWSCSTTKNGHGDNPVFIANMAAWMRARPGGVLYQAYWNTTDGANAVLHSATPTVVPKAAAAYRAEFGPAQSAPVISAIAAQTIAMNTVSGPIPFTIGDAETAPASLTLLVNASNTSLVPLANITLSGSGANRAVTIKPATNQTGWSTIWIKVSDGKLTSVTSFVVSVVAPEVPKTITAPAISALPDCVVPVNGSTGPLSFTVHDAESPASALTLIVRASNTALIPAGNIVLGGSGSARTITVRPAANQTGWSTIWVKVSDGALESFTSFVVNVSGAVLSGVDVGQPTIAGSYTISGGTTTIRAGGYDIYNRRDEFSFARQFVTGDAELTVRLASLTRAHDWTKAGLMFRGSLAEDAAFVAVFVTPAKGIVLQWRAVNGGGTASSAASPGAAPEWLRVLRSGDVFFAFSSNDGVEWDFVETVTVALPEQVPAGLAVTSHATTTAATAVFEQFTVD